MPRRETSELPTDPWQELLHQGDLLEESDAATPAIVDALSRGTDDDANWLYLLAAMAVGRPETRAGRIRDEIATGADTWRRLLRADDAETRAGAVAVLVVSGAATADDGRELARLGRDDDATVVRAHAALGLGVTAGYERDLEDLLDDRDSIVAHAAALALARLGRRDERIAVTLGRALIAGAESPTERPPWDELYADWPDELVGLGEAARPVLPMLLDALETTEDPLLPVLADAALAIAADDDDRREVARRLVSRSAELWKRAHLRSTPADHGLPERRDALRAWLDR
jgi:hypothetical protein